MIRALVRIGFLTLGLWASGLRAEASHNFPKREVWVRGGEALPRSIAERYGAQLVWSSELVPGLRRVRFNQAEDRDSLLREFQALPGVLYAEPNFSVYRNLPSPSKAQLTFEPQLFGGLFDPLKDDPFTYLQWALTASVGIHPSGAWQQTLGSHDVRVAVIDTGAVVDHPDLAANIVGGYDVLLHSNVLSDPNGHGTHVAGIIGAVTGNGIGIAGVAGNIGLVPIRAVPLHGDESDADVVEAIEYAVRAGARLINCSFGKEESSQAVAEVINAAGEHGILVIVAAGNKDADLNTYRHFPASFHTPNMLVVASMDTDGALARSSNYGLGRVDLAAPGERILSTWKDLSYTYLGGTSMAAPQVTGVAALMLSANPRLGYAELRRALLESVDRAPELNGKVTSGGRLDATKAVQAAAALLR